MEVRAPLQGFDSFWAGRTQGVALGYLIVPRWGVGGALGCGWRAGAWVVRWGVGGALGRGWRVGAHCRRGNLSPVVFQQGYGSVAKPEANMQSQGENGEQ